MFFYGTTDIGKKRVVNQDNFRIKEYSKDVTVAVVCDGMGGAKGGGVASSLAVSAFIGKLDESADVLTQRHSDENADELISDVLIGAVECANTAVFTSAGTSNELTGMGTTLVCALVTPKRIYAVNVGDSRMYTCNRDAISQVTKDHSYVQYLVDIGKLSPKKAKKSNQRNIITRAVGTEVDVEADLYTLTRTDADKQSFILLCSDGLTNLVEPREILAGLRFHGNVSGDALKKAATRFVSLANERGGSDNITVVILAF